MVDFNMMRQNLQGQQPAQQQAMYQDPLSTLKQEYDSRKIRKSYRDETFWSFVQYRMLVEQINILTEALNELIARVENLSKKEKTK